MKLGRNDPCHCGSGKKYKKCCLGLEENVVEDDPLHTAELRAHNLLATEFPAGRLTGTGEWLSVETAESGQEFASRIAPSLGALLDFLAREHCPRFLYRGQVRHYPGLIPSGYRGAMPPGAGDKSVIPLDPERYLAGM